MMKWYLKKVQENMTNNTIQAKLQSMQLSPPYKWKYQQSKTTDLQVVSSIWLETRFPYILH